MSLWGVELSVWDSLLVKDGTGAAHEGVGIDAGFASWVFSCCFN